MKRESTYVVAYLKGLALLGFAANGLQLRTASRVPIEAVDDNERDSTRDDGKYDSNRDISSRTGSRVDAYERPRIDSMVSEHSTQRAPWQ